MGGVGRFSQSKSSAVLDFTGMADCFSRTLTTSATSVTEGNAVTFTVTPSTVSATAQTLSYQVTGAATTAVSAATNADFSVITGTVTVPANAASATFTVTPTSDITVEGFEGFKVTLLDSSFNSVASSSTVVINDPSTSVSGSTFTLTTGVDAGTAFTGGVGDDTFVATPTTLTILDNINGGAGTDVLAITDGSNTAYTLPASTTTISGIETLTLIHSSDAAADIIVADVSGLTDLRSVIIQNTGVDIVTTGGVDGVSLALSANVTAVTVTGGASTQDIDTVTVSDAGTNGASTTDKLATLTLTGLTGAATISSEALTTLNLNAVAGLVTNTDSVTTDTRALTINVAGGTNAGVSDAGATTTTVNITGATAALGTVTTSAATTLNYNVNAALTAGTVVANAATTVNYTANAAVTATTLTTGAATTENITANAVITASTVGAATVTALNLSGSAAMTITQTAAAAGVITSTGSGARTLTAPIAAGQQYNASAGTGADTVTFAATGTKSSTLGGGNDVATFSAVMGAGGSVDGGDGTDTVVLTAANAVTLSAASTFAGTISSFEKLSIGAYGASVGNANADDSTISLANIDSISNVVLAGAGAAGNAQTYTISGNVSGGSLELTASLSDADITLALTGAFTGLSDSFTLKASAADGFANLGSLTLASVETVAIVLDDTDATAATVMFDLNLDATVATSVTVTGDAGITFANSSFTALRLLDASGVTATGAAGVVTLTANAGMDTVIKGGAGNDVLTGNTGNDSLVGGAGNDALVGAAGVDTISGGDGNDSITGGTGVDNLTGGAGVDTFTTTVGAAYTTATADRITDFATGAAGDILQISIADSTAIPDVGIVAAGNGSTAIAGNLVIKTMTAGTGVTLAATDEIVVISGTFANSAALLTSIGTGAGIITKSTTNTTTNGLLVVWSDGTDTHVSAVSDTGADAPMTTADLVATDIVVLTGVLTGFDTANFVAVA